MKKWSLLLYMLIFLTSCSEDQITSNDTSNNAIPVEVIEVEKSTFSKNIELVGKTIPSEQSPITTSVPSQIKKVHVKNGQDVKSGDLLISLDDSSIRNQLSQANSTVKTLETTRSRINTTIQQQKTADGQIDSVINESIQQLKTITTPDNKDQIGDVIKSLGQVKESDLTGSSITSTALPLINSQLEQARAAVKEAKKALETTEITSPIDGTISNLKAQTGAPAIPGTPLAIVSSKQELTAMFPINDFQIKHLSKGMEVTISFDDNSKDVKAKINKITMNDDSNKKKSSVTVPLPDGDNRFKPDRVVTAGVEIQHKDEVITIPNDALLFDDGHPYVFLARNGLAYRQSIDIKEESKSSVLIGSGIKENETVVTDGKYQLTNRSKISIKK